MKLYLEINDKTYYLGQTHKRQALKLYDNARAMILTTLTAEKIKFRTYNVKANDVKTTLFDGSKLKLKLSINNNNYIVQGKDLSDNPPLASVDSLVKQAIDNV